MFLKQAFVDFKHLGPTRVKLGRFEYFDGTEVKAKDPTLAAVVQTRVSQHRLISNFGFTAVQRTFDGGQFSSECGAEQFHFFLGARPTAGIFQVDGMPELDIEVYYGAFTRTMETPHSAAQFRVFGLGYVDDRNTILKTDNRPTPVRTADINKIQLATYGGGLRAGHQYHECRQVRFPGLGSLPGRGLGKSDSARRRVRRGTGLAAPGKAPETVVEYRLFLGSGDGNPNDSIHGTFFQVLTTPRQYARFPFYNMMNNGDVYGTLNLKPTSKLLLRSEAHALWLANTADLWYSGGGAFQPKTFGYTGRPSNNFSSLAKVWDLSADYQITRSVSTTFYYGHAWGEAVIAKLYPKDPNGQLFFLETNFHF